MRRSPELTANTTEGGGIKATYRLVYEYNVVRWGGAYGKRDGIGSGGMHSLPASLSFPVSHPTATRPVIYVELGSGRYPQNLVSHSWSDVHPCLRDFSARLSPHLLLQSRILLQRVEGAATWVAASIPATSPALTSNQRSLVFWDNTTRATHWGARVGPEMPLTRHVCLA
jgi:hypothetical protein